MEIVKPKLDIVFKSLFTKDMEMLKAFVGDLLEIERGKIQSVTVINPNILSEDADGKQSQLDLSMLVDDKIVNVEIQLSNKGNFIERSLYYWAKLYSNQLKSGEPYEELKRTITINILDFNLFKGNDNAYSSFSLREKERNELLTDKCSINFFELLKVGKEIDKDNLKQRRILLCLIKQKYQKSKKQLFFSMR